MSDSSARQSGPFEEQRRVYDLLSQETRHLILQNVLGHPENLPSLGELDHTIPKSTGAISDQLDRLTEAGILAEYTCEESLDARDLPSQFYGPTEHGVEVLAEYNYLRGLPVARAVYRNTRKSERIERHESAPRPELPSEVVDALTYGSSEDVSPLARRLREQNADEDSLSDQITVVETLRRREIGPDDEGVTRVELDEAVGDELEHDLSTVLDSVTATGLVERAEPTGPGTFVVDDRTDEIVDGRVESVADEYLSALIDHLDSELLATPTEIEGGVAVADGAGATVRHVLADAFDVQPSAVPARLRDGDAVETLNTAITALGRNESVETGENDGRLIFRNAAYRYRLTKAATRLLEARS